MTGIYLPVHSYEESSSPLHVRSLSETHLQWDFPASYTGHRSACWLPGATSDMAFIAWVGGDEYTPGDPFGYAPAATASNAQSLYLTRTSPVSTRLNLWTKASDRAARFGDTEPEIQYAEGVSVVTPTSLPPVVRVRVVRVAVDAVAMSEMGITYSNGEVPYRVVLDRVFSRDAIPYLSEADFLGGGEFDIDWANFAADTANLPDTVHDEKVTYLIVVGDNPIELAPASGTTSTISAIGTITRRFDMEYSHSVAIGLAGGDVLRDPRPTFVWSSPNEDTKARRFGSSYVAFRILMYDSDIDRFVWVSDVTRAPVQDSQGRFAWTAPFRVGDTIVGIDADQHTPAEYTFNAHGNYKWYVAMYNSKFKPAADPADDGWSEEASFSTAVDA